MVAIRELAFQHQANRKAHINRERGFIYYHGQRVASIAVELRKRLFPTDNAHDQILMVASYFHDVAKGIEPHSYYGASLVREILRDHCTEAQLDKISEIIKRHQFRDKSKNYNDLIKIVQDADILDHFGTIGLWMNFHYYASTEGSIMESVEYYNNDYQELAEKCRVMLNYELSKTIFDEKHQFVMDFAARMTIEAQGKLFF